MEKLWNDGQHRKRAYTLSMPIEFVIDVIYTGFKKSRQLTAIKHPYLNTSFLVIEILTQKT